MKIAIPAVSKNINSPFEHRFAQANYFMIVNPESKKYEFVPGSSCDKCGLSEIQKVQLLIDNHVNALLACECNKNLVKKMEHAGIIVHKSAKMNIDSIVKDLTNKLEKSDNQYLNPKKNYPYNEDDLMEIIPGFIPEKRF